MARRNTRWTVGLSVAALGIGLAAFSMLQPRTSETPAVGGMLHPPGAPGPRILGVVAGPSSAQLCDPELWEGITGIVVRNAPGEAWVSEERWPGLSWRSRAAVAKWSAQCTSSGSPLALLGSPSGRTLGHYSVEEGLAYSP